MAKPLNIGKILADRMKAAGFRLLRYGDAAPAEKPFAYFDSDLKVRPSEIPDVGSVAFEIELHADSENDFDRLIATMNDEARIPGVPFSVYLHGLIRSDGPQEEGIYKFQYVYKFRQYTPTGEEPSEEKPTKEE